MHEAENRMTLKPILPALTSPVPADAYSNLVIPTHWVYSKHSVVWMPNPLSRRNSSAYGVSSILRYLFPRTRARARAHLSRFRHETLAALKHRTQSRIYRYIVRRQDLKLKRAPSILQRLRARTRRAAAGSYLENAAKLRRQQLTQASEKAEPITRAMSYQDSYAPREPGARRRKLAGYLKAANELRQTYQQQYASNWNRKETTYDDEDDTPGSFPDAAIVRSGEEEMILFPSYARKHVKRKPEVEPGTIQETPGEGRDVRDTAGAGDAEFWKQQWDQYEDDNAVVDVDVRGWIYSPHKGQMSRKQRLFIGLARQLVGIQAPTAGAIAQSSSPSPNSSRDPSPGHLGHRERAQVRQAQRDEMLTAREAEDILRRGEKEAEMAAQGAYSEKPATEDDDDTNVYHTQSRESVHRQDSRGNLKVHQLSHTPSNSSLRNDSITAVQKRASWNQPGDMNTTELAEANARLMARLRHFLAIPMANTPISVFFYNDKISKQRTVYTNPSGHFSITAALDFVPTHVRILASEELSATEEIIITESHGVSVISDIDDTIKHSAISNGAREIFRNAFIRELSDLTIEGVKEWYNRMAEMGIKFHYVSNSPWQLFPVISKYFSLAGLPPGSFHLKQYSGMLQGIFEPVAERKKSTLDKIARDFPERRFILIGDSGEADLEVYTDFVLENPGRVVAVFIRDVTTPEGGGFFDPSMAPISGDRSPPLVQPRNSNGSGSVQIRGQSPKACDEDDPELRAAIQASLRHMEGENQRRSKSLFPQIDEDHPDLRPQLPPRNGSQPTPNHDPATNLIDLSPGEVSERLPGLRRANTDTKTETLKHRASVASTNSAKSAPAPPRKPIALRSGSGDLASASSPQNTSKAPPPPKPRNASSIVNQSSPLSQRTSVPTTSTTTKPARPPVAPKPNFQTDAQQQTYAGIARDKLVSVYNNLPSFSSANSQADPAKLGSTSNSNPSQTTQNIDSTKKAPPPPPPPRRGITTYPAAAASYVGTKASSAWQHAPSVPHPPIPYHSRPNMNAQAQGQSFSTASAAHMSSRTNTSSTLGPNGASGNGYGPDGQTVNKREQLWRQRWARAEEILGAKGVVLKSWRVGSDMVKESERVIQEALKTEKDDAR